MSMLDVQENLGSRINPLRAAIFFVGAALITVAVPFLDNVYSYGMALAIGACWITPLWYDWARRRVDLFEPIHLVGLLCVIYFGLGTVWVLADPRIAYDTNIVPYIPKAVTVCLVAYLCMLIGYYMPWAGKKASPAFADFPRGPLFLIVPGAIGTAAYVSWSAWFWSNKIGISLPLVFSSMGQAAPVFLFAWCLGWVLVLSGQASPIQRKVHFTFLCPCAVVVILANMNDKSLIFLLGALPMIGLWYGRRKLPWIPLSLMMATLVLVIFPFNNTYRRLDPRISSAQRLELTTRVIQDWNRQEYFDASIGGFQRRMALINSVAIVIRDVPRWIPYASGETLFLPAMVYFTPRLVWPDKPLYRFGREFAETFRVVHVLDTKTNIASTPPAEFYWNFDVPGVIVGMVFWGVWMRFLYRRYGEANRVGPISRAIHMTLLVQFVTFEGGIAGQFTGTIRVILVIEALRAFGRHFGWIERRANG